MNDPKLDILRELHTLWVRENPGTVLRREADQVFTLRPAPEVIDEVLFYVKHLGSIYKVAVSLETKLGE